MITLIRNWKLAPHFCGGNWVKLFSIFYFLFSISFAQPSNDDCSNAALLCPNTQVSSNTIGATTECGTADTCTFGFMCFTTENSSWFYFVTNDNGGEATVTVSNISSGSLQGALIAAAVPCNASSYTIIDCGLGSDTSFNLTSTTLLPNTVYWVMVDGVSANETSFQIAVFGAAVQWTVNITVEDQTCPNSCDGTATASPQDGTPPYTYLWENNQTTQTATGLCDGTYNVTVTDSVGCKTLKTATVGTETPAVATASSTPVECGTTCTGTATAALSSGPTPYSYQWSNSQTTQTVTGLCEGTYNVTVTDSAGCDTSTTVTVSEPEEISEVITSSTPVQCGNLGTASVDSVSGGTSPYTYNWTNGSSSSSITNLSTGNYSVTVTDANGCEKTGETTVVENECPYRMSPENKFSPNGDGKNDTWAITNAERYPDNKVIVLNRWGQRVYSATGYNNQDVVWDGKHLGFPVPDGVYYYFLYEDKNDKEGEFWNGSVTILR